MAIRVRELEQSEHIELERRSRSRTLPYRDVQRASLILLNAAGELAPAIGETLGLDAITVRKWIKRFNEEGLAGLDDLARSGRSRPENAPYRSELVCLVRTRPSELELPFAPWTIERLQTALWERCGKRLSQDTVWQWLRSEGLRWQKQESWLRPVLNTPEAVAEFEEKRGSSSKPIAAPKASPARQNQERVRESVSSV